MTNIKPIDINKHVKYLIRYVRSIDSSKLLALRVFILLVVIEACIKWRMLYDLVVPNGILLNWNLIFLTMVILVFIIFLLWDLFWYYEYTEHEKTKKERDNLKEDLKISEERRLTDVITGVPNSESLKEDIDNNFSKSNNKMQYIFIDLKDFSKINNKFGFNRTNVLLRTIAQTIYKRMRRDEKMYRVYPGGDKFVFIIFGDQSDALGFSNRLVSIFKEISDKTTRILGRYIDLSFYCAIVEMYNNDSYENLSRRVESVYRISKEGNSHFTICWHPIDVEKTFSTNKNKLKEYERAKELFQIMTPVDNDYDL